MKIEYLRLKNFKAFKNAEMKKIPDFCVIVGANGSGKSTIFTLFGFLKDALTNNVNIALMKLGGSRGFQEVKSRNSEGPIEIELKFRNKSDFIRLDEDSFMASPAESQIAFLIMIVLALANIRQHLLLLLWQLYLYSFYNTLLISLADIFSLCDFG